MRSKVDLPDPLRPTRLTRSPAVMDSPAPTRSGVTPKVRLMSCSSSNGGGIANDISRVAGTIPDWAPPMEHRRLSRV
jgi:hypothetical protein